MRISFVVGALAFSALFCGATFADNATTPVATPAATPAAMFAAKPAMDAAAKAAKSDECYKQADAKDLHLKERKNFHRDCMKAP